MPTPWTFITGSWNLNSGIFSVNVDFDTTKVNAEVNSCIKRAQQKLDNQVMNDSNYYCPIDTSMLQKSAMTSVMGSGKIEWRAPYAKKQYYGNFDHSRSRNPNATAQWFETAKARKEKQWEQLVNDEIKHG